MPISADPPPFDRVFVAPEIADLPFTRDFVSRTNELVPVDFLAPGAPPPRGKRAVYLTREPGAFLKPCPCSPSVVRCGYWVLTPMFQCPFSCTYCFLRFYAPEEPLTLYANLEEAERQFQTAAGEWRGAVRLGTGEFADSLALDRWTRHSRWLRALVAGRPNVLLELKTKSANVETLLDRPPLENLVIAWSVNPPKRIAADEIGCAPLEARLEAASLAASAGYRVAFHLDPIVHDEAWESEYRELIERLFDEVDPIRVAWVSLGTLRFPPRFLDRWGRVLRGKRIFFEEFLQCEDAKLRYFWPVRRRIYRELAGELRRRGGSALRVYLCMEPQNMWCAALGWKPEEGEAEAYLTGAGSERRAGLLEE